MSDLAMLLSDIGLAFIERWEQLRLHAYPDSGGVWTIGWGHTGADVHEGMTCTMGQAGSWLRHDADAAAAVVNRYVKVSLTQAQFDALVDFVFNVGGERFITSTLLKRLNAGDFAGAAAQFDRWIYDDGKIERGLVKRRAAERRRFTSQELPCPAPSLSASPSSPPAAGSLFSAISSGCSTWLSRFSRKPSPKDD